MPSESPQMSDRRIENLNVFSELPLITPVELKRKFPLTEKIVNTVMSGQNAVKDILDRKDHRKFMIVGPCSIHDVDAAIDYARKLKTLATEVEDELLLIMRVYFEKPRTRTGWQGLINDPYLDKSGDMEKGLHLARQLLLEIAELGLPAAGEALDLVTPQYVQDLFSWTCIGARTTESQTHRKMASGFSTAVGFKNATDGGLEVAINAMHSAAHRNSFVSVNPAGKVAVIRTKGNPHTHIVLRGGGGKPNYDYDSIARCQRLHHEADLACNIMIDCSHGNSRSDPSNQVPVLRAVTEQIVNGNTSIAAVMLESNLLWGKQPIGDNPSKLRYGISITDACIDWPTTATAIREFAVALTHLRQKKSVVT